VQGIECGGEGHGCRDQLLLEVIVGGSAWVVGALVRFWHEYGDCGALLQNDGGGWA
jgi:hypothetical protein